MNNLVIIGNGFDLAHDMKTSYNHFMEYLIDCHINSNAHNNIFDFDADFLNFNHFRENKSPASKMKMKRSNGIYSSHEYFKNKFVESVIKDLCLNNWCDIEKKYYELLNSDDKNSIFYKNPEKLNLNFEILKEELVIYLKIEEYAARTTNSYKDLFSLIDSRETAILNFNYTNTIQNLYSNEIKESKIIHIHGELLNEQNPIIFGYAANDEESRMLIGKDNNEYMRNIKKHLYKRTENEKILTNYLEGTKDINVIILGHSCGLSDKLILNQILNHKNIKSINIFYYEVYEHYFQTQVNIDRIMNWDEHFAKLVPFNSSHRMPQHNDTPEQQEAFVKYISPLIGERKERKKNT